MTDLQKNSFIEPGESCPHLLKIAMENYENDEKIIKIMLLKELGCLVQKYGIAFFFLISNMLSNTFSDFISDMRVTDHRRYDW